MVHSKRSLLSLLQRIVYHKTEALSVMFWKCIYKFSIVSISNQAHGLTNGLTNLLHYPDHPSKTPQSQPVGK